MVTKQVLALAVLLALSQASYCPIYGCDYSLSNRICGTVTTTSTFKVNGNGCESGYFCSGLGLASWASTYTVGSSSNYACLLLPTVEDTTTTTVYVATPCGTKQTGRNFKANSALVTCSQVSDCLLEDNTVTSCDCTLRSDGLGVCRPDISNDQVFAEYWNDCGSDNTLTREADYVYWNLFVLYWTFIQGNLSCIDVFIEKQLLDDARDSYNGAGALAVGAFALAAFY